MKVIAELGLWALVAFMAFGFTRANVQASRPAIVLSVLIAVVLPAAGGPGLMYSQVRGDLRNSDYGSKTWRVRFCG
jgi:hypothetical protein